MTRRSPLFKITALLLLALSVGCQPQQPFYLFEDGDLSHYKGMATEIEVPDAGVKPLEEVIRSSAPLTLGTSEKIEYWDISLEEAIKIAMNNSKIIRSLGGSATSLDSLTRSPDLASSVYDPAITETDPRYGTEAALSAFDTLFSTSAFWVEDRSACQCQQHLFLDFHQQLLDPGCRDFPGIFAKIQRDRWFVGPCRPPRFIQTATVLTRQWPFRLVDRLDRRIPSTPVARCRRPVQPDCRSWRGSRVQQRRYHRPTADRRPIDRV